MTNARRVNSTDVAWNINISWQGKTQKIVFRINIMIERSQANVGCLQDSDKKKLNDNAIADSLALIELTAPDEPVKFNDMFYIKHMKIWDTNEMKITVFARFIFTLFALQNLIHGR